MHRRGLTLIELLAVITLITLTAGVTLAGRSSGSTEARLRAVTADIIAFDAHARRFAERHGAVTLERVDAEHLRMVNTTGQVAHLTVRHGAEVQLLVDDVQATSVIIDALGRSADYDIVIQLQDLERPITVAGLTGWTEESTP